MASRSPAQRAAHKQHVLRYMQQWRDHQEQAKKAAEARRRGGRDYRVIKNVRAGC